MTEVATPGTPTIEEQIKSTIEVALAIAHEEQKETITQAIKETVNHKIDNFRAEQTIVNNSQNKVLAELTVKVDKVTNLVEFADGAATFFSVTKTASKWVIYITSACVALWAFIRFVVMSATIK